jgi:hypothetical protein
MFYKGHRVLPDAISSVDPWFSASFPSGSWPLLLRPIKWLHALLVAPIRVVVALVLLVLYFLFAKTVLVLTCSRPPKNCDDPPLPRFTSGLLRVGCRIYSRLTLLCLGFYWINIVDARNSDACKKSRRSCCRFFDLRGLVVNALVLADGIPRAQS